MYPASFRALALAALCLTSQAGAADRTGLFERLGGAAGVSAIADALIDRVAADPLHGGSFRDVKLPRVKRLLAGQLCELTGGPCRYAGDPMKESHAGLHITEADFYAMVKTLRSILDERHVEAGAKNELLRLLAPMKRDVVERSVARGPRPPPAAAPP